MSTHETVRGADVIEPGSDRSFGLIVGGIFAVIGAYQYLTGSSLFAWFLLPGAILVLLGLARPAVLHPLNIAWMRLGLLLGRVVTPIVMFLVFVVSIVPIGLILRVMGKDPLKLKRQASSYWIERTPPGPSPESLEDQF